MEMSTDVCRHPRTKNVHTQLCASRMHCLCTHTPQTTLTLGRPRTTHSPQDALLGNYPSIESFFEGSVNLYNFQITIWRLFRLDSSLTFVHTRMSFVLFEGYHG